MWWSWLFPSPSPSAQERISVARGRLLSILPEHLELEQGHVADLHEIRVRRKRAEPSCERVLVLLHGYGAGNALFAPSLPEIAECFDLVLLPDLPGFGASLRGPARSFESAEDAEAFMTENLARWWDRSVPEGARVCLAGHSLGAFVAANFALAHPERVQHLALLDPFGMSVKPQEQPNEQQQRSYAMRAVYFLEGLITPFSILRASGSYLGKALVQRSRQDILAPFARYYGDEADELVSEYIYASNSQQPATGEDAFRALSLPIGWAAHPLQHRLLELPEDIPCSFVYGENSWMSRSGGERFIESRQRDDALYIVRGAGHHVYIDNVADFAAHIGAIALKV